MEREYQSGHLTVLLSTTGTGIPGSSLTPEKRKPETARAGRPPAQAGLKPTTLRAKFAAIDLRERRRLGALPAVICNATPSTNKPAVRAGECAAWIQQC